MPGGCSGRYGESGHFKGDEDGQGADRHLPGGPDGASGRVSGTLWGDEWICAETAECGGGKDDSDRKICRCAGYEEQRDDHEGGHGKAEGKGRREGDQPGGGRADEVAASSCIYIKS